MADIVMLVDTALASVPINKMPLVDDTDFKTIEDAVVYNAAGLALFWNFTTVAGVKTVTAVTPTSGGSYDWTDFSTSGMYGIEIPASGGASINNDTEGFGHFSGVATGILPFIGPTIQFSPAHIVHGTVTGTEWLRVNAHAPNVVVSAGVATIKKPDNSTTDLTKTVGTDAAAVPIVSLT